MTGPSSLPKGRFIYQFSPKAFGSLRHILEGDCGGVLKTSVVDPLGDAASLTFLVNGVLLTLDYDHWESFVLLHASAHDRGVLQSLRARFDAGEYPVLNEREE